MRYAIGIDIGGTNTKIGIVDLYDKRVIERKIIPTVNGGQKDCFNRIIFTIKELLTAHKLGIQNIKRIGIGILGPVINRKIVVPVNGFHWEKPIDISKELEPFFATTVYAENDVNVIALGECIARGNITNMIAIAIGTDIGAGFIINGSIYSGKDGTAGEIAHVIVDNNGPLCECGRRGCFSQYCGGYNFKKSYLKLFERMTGEKVDEDLSVKDIFEAAKNGNRLAEESVITFVRHLAKQIVNLNVIWNPDLFIIAGGISMAGDYLIDKINKECSNLKFENGYIIEPRIEMSILGNDAGILGAAFIGETIWNTSGE